MRYVAQVRYDEQLQMWWPTPAPHILPEHGARIEWHGLERFPGLDRSLLVEMSGVASKRRIWMISASGPAPWRSLSEVEVSCVCRP